MTDDDRKSSLEEKLREAEENYEKFFVKARVYGAIANRFRQALEDIARPGSTGATIIAKEALAWRHSESGGVPMSAIEEMDAILRGGQSSPREAEYKVALEKIAMTKGIPVEAYEVAADALCWARKFRAESKDEKSLTLDDVPPAWRTGTKNLHTIYLGDEPYGFAATPEKARRLVRDANTGVRTRIGWDAKPLTIEYRCSLCDVRAESGPLPTEPGALCVYPLPRGWILVPVADPAKDDELRCDACVRDAK
jgi:hypothetical protein